MTFRVMTFNIRGAVPGRDGMNAWEYRALLNTAVIKRTSPDLIGFLVNALRSEQVWPSNLSTCPQT